MRITGFARWKHYVVQVIAVVPDSELSPEAIAAYDGCVVLRSGRREWFKSFQCLRGLFLKKGFVPLRLIVEVLHSRYMQFLGFGKPAMRLPTRAGEPGNSPMR